MSSQVTVLQGRFKWTTHASDTVAGPCEKCKQLNGKTFNVEEVANIKIGDEFHPHCACTLDPEAKVLESFTWVSPIEESFLTKPLRVGSCMIHPGLTRTKKLYLADELKEADPTFIGHPIYGALEHHGEMVGLNNSGPFSTPIGAGNEVGIIDKCWFGLCKKHNEPALNYEASIVDEDFAERIRRGLIRNVSISADYEVMEPFEGWVPHGLTGRHLALVASPGDVKAGIEPLEVLESIGRLHESVFQGHTGNGETKEGKKLMEDKEKGAIPSAQSTNPPTEQKPIEPPKPATEQKPVEQKPAETETPGSKQPPKQLMVLSDEQWEQLSPDLTDEEVELFDKVFDAPDLGEANWIQGAIKNPGGLHRALGVPVGQKIPRMKIIAAAKKGGRLGRMARMALTLGKLNHSVKESFSVDELRSAYEESKKDPTEVPSATEQLLADLKNGIHGLIESMKGPKPEAEKPKVEESAKPQGKVEEAKPQTKGGTNLSEDKTGKGIVEESQRNGPAATTKFDYRKVVCEAFKATRGDVKAAFERLNHMYVTPEGKVEEAAYSASAAGSAIPQLWSQEVTQLLPRVAVMSATCIQHPELQGKPGNTLNIPTLNVVTFAAGTDQTGATAQAPTTSSVPVTIIERVAEIDMSRYVLEDAVPDLIDKINLEIAQAYEWDQDSIVISWMTTPAAAIKGTLACATALKGTVIAAACGSMRAGTIEPYWMVIHPVQEASLLQDQQFTNAMWYGNRDVIQSGRIYSYLGLNIVVSPQLPVSGTGGTAVYSSFLYCKDALALAGKRDLAVDRWYDVKLRQEVIVASGRYGGTIVKPLGVWLVSSVGG